MRRTQGAVIRPRHAHFSTPSHRWIKRRWIKRRSITRCSARRRRVKSAMLDNVKDAPVKARESVGGWWNNSREFLAEVRNEMKRVTWPSRREVYATTVVVIITSVVFGLYLWGVDIALSTVLGWIFRSLGAA